MRVYQKCFGVRFVDVDSMLQWVESHLKGYDMQCVENIGLAFCECAHNIIEHHIQRIDKIQLYTQAQNIPCAKNLLLKKQKIICKLFIKTRYILIMLRFPFKPCYAYKNRSYRLLGGRGKLIVGLCHASIRTQVHYVGSKLIGITTLRCPIVKPFIF